MTNKVEKFKIKLEKKDQNQGEDYFYIQQYKNWRNDLSNKEFEPTFFILYKDFEVHLKDISPGALKLYLFYGFHAKNDTGLLWYGIETISDYFTVSARTINNWNLELEERGLIARLSRERGRNKITYLLPFSLNLLSNIDIDIMNKESFKTVYGELYQAFHLFQWRKGADKDIETYDVPFHMLIVVYAKKFKNNNYIQHSAFQIKIVDEPKGVIDSQHFNKGILTFKSDIQYPGIVSIKGIAVNPKINLKLKYQLKSLINELIDPNTDFGQYENVELQHQ